MEVTKTKEPSRNFKLRCVEIRPSRIYVSGPITLILLPSTILKHLSALVPSILYIYIYVYIRIYKI
jgi:hypothetical protein